ncbi:uncharacterized protein At4g38062 [Ananas comosus]|uniref:Uncharacterized protein At4g38062 n=1 Tax=Ananas comosus TaxID=4615 RepID=A0A199VMF2_ANACO|nr:uncharacterized protein At4g38062 [Ananas comosus]OAY78076.1 Uncharacterized protein ACMD2_13810 [Ananas comosus]
MGETCKELEDLKSEIAVLKEESRAKSELAETLRKAHDEAWVDIAAKDDEITTVKRLYDDLRSSFAEKESALKSLGSTYENLKAGFRETVENLESENKNLVSALEAANSERGEQEKTISAFKEEIEGLKRLLFEARRKCSDAEERAQAPREVRRRDELLSRLEEEKGGVEEKLKWKSEQFTHLKEAHGKLQEEFRAANREWGLERSNLVGEIHALQTKLDSTTRLNEGLKSQLAMCNQALAREESRRKMLEAQVSELKARCENVVSEFEEARSTVELLTTKRDEEIASLRNLLATKITLLKEMEYNKAQLEQENQELTSSLKEYQEAEISGADASASLKTLRQKFRALEQVHKGCSEKLRAKESEWTKQMKKLGTDLDECLSQLCSKDKQLLQLKDELEGSYSLNVQQKLEHEEIHSVLMVVKSKFWESCLYLENLKLEMEQRGEMFGKRLVLMAKQLEEKNAALIQAQNEKLREGQMAGLLQSRIEHLESVEDDYSKMRVTLDAYKEMLDNSSRNVDRLKEEASEREKVLREDLRKALEALEQANCAVAERSSELKQVEFDLERQKLATERLEKLKTDMEIETTRYCDENQAMRRELEDVLLGKMEVEEALKEEKERSRRAIAENDKRTEELQQLIAVLKEDNSRLELEAISAKLEAENSLEEEKVRFHCIIAEKDKRIEELQQLSSVLKEDISRLELEATSVRLEANKSTEEEKKRFLETGRDMEKRFMEIKCQLDSLEQKCMQRMHEILRTFEQEKTKWSKVIEEKENVIADVQVTVQSLEHDLKQSLEDAAALKLEEKQHEIERLFDTFEKIVTVHVIEGQDNLFKNILIEEMEKELETLKLKLKFEEEQLVTLKNMLQQAKAEIAKERLDSEKDKHRILNELKSTQSRKDSLEDQLGELKSKTKVFHNIIAHLVSERKELVGQVTEFSDSIALIVNADEKLISDWKRVMLKIRSKGDIMSSEKEGLNSEKDKANSRNCSSSIINKAGQVSDRSPLKEYNC